MLAVISPKKSLKGQILVDIWPMNAIFVNFHIIELLDCCVFKTPIPHNGKREVDSIGQRDTDASI